MLGLPLMPSIQPHSRCFSSSLVPSLVLLPANRSGLPGCIFCLAAQSCCPDAAFLREQAGQLEQAARRS